jgi:hypothetical protein
MVTETYCRLLDKTNNYIIVIIKNSINFIKYCNLVTRTLNCKHDDLVKAQDGK